MSKTTAALEAAVSAVIANRAVEGARQTNRQRVDTDRAFAAILKLIAPRIRHFVRQYGLLAHWDDAEQACAIGVHRAIEAYDPTKAQFTTFVNWQLRGELQALRFRLMTDQRPSAKKVEATTVSIHAGGIDGDGESMGLEGMLVDEDALERTEAGASAHMAQATRAKLIEEYVDHLRTAGLDQLKRRARTNAPDKREATPGQPRLRAELYPVPADELAELEAKIASHREAIERRLGVAETPETGDEAARERSRQIAKRAAVAMAEIARRDLRFAPGVGARAGQRRPIAETVTD